MKLSINRNGPPLDPIVLERKGATFGCCNMAALYSTYTSEKRKVAKDEEESIAGETWIWIKSKLKTEKSINVSELRAKLGNEKAIGKDRVKRIIDRMRDESTVQDVVFEERKRNQEYIKLK